MIEKEIKCSYEKTDDSHEVYTIKNNAKFSKVCQDINDKMKKALERQLSDEGYIHRFYQSIDKFQKDIASKNKISHDMVVSKIIEHDLEIINNNSKLPEKGEYFKKCFDSSDYDELTNSLFDGMQEFLVTGYRREYILDFYGGFVYVNTIENFNVPNIQLIQLKKFDGKYYLAKDCIYESYGGSEENFNKLLKQIL